MKKLLTTIIICCLIFGYAIGQTSEDVFLIDLDAEASIELWKKEYIKVEVYWTEKGTSRYIMEQIIPKSEYLKTGQTSGSVIINT